MAVYKNGFGNGNSNGIGSGKCLDCTKRVKLSRLIFLLLLLLICVPLISHHYLASLEPNTEDHKNHVNSRKLNSKNHIGYDHTSDLNFRVNELKRIRTSVNTELRELESRRQKLQAEIQEYNTHIYKLKSSYETTQKDLEKLKINIQQAKVEMREVTERNMPAIKAPLKIVPSAVDDVILHPSLKTHLCRMSNCFDYSRCSLLSGFPVYFYDVDEHPITPVESNLKMGILNSLHSNSHVTFDPRVACVYIVIIGADYLTADKKQIDSKLAQLPHWNGDGRNHILLRITQRVAKDNAFQGVHTGRAILMQSGFLRSEYRSKFDLVLPLALGKASGALWQDLMPILPLFRKYLISFIGEHIDKYISSEMKVIQELKQLEKGKTDDMFYFRFNCEGERTLDSLPGEWTLCEPKSQRHQVTSQSTFSLIISPSNISIISSSSLQTRLYEALNLGAIPVIIGDKVVLPYSEILQWEKSVIRLPKARITELHFYLRSFTHSDISALKLQGRMVFEKYFGTTKAIIDTALATIRTRLNIPPLPMKEAPSPSVFNGTVQRMVMDFAEVEPEGDEVLGPVEPPFPSPVFLRNFSTPFHALFNRPGDPFHLYPNTPFDPGLTSDAKFHGSSTGFRPINNGAGGAGKEFSQSIGGNHPQEQFTIVMLTYEREAVLINAVKRLKGLAFLNKVLVIWNSPKPPAYDIKWPDIGVPVQVVRTKKNSLNNRFLPYDVVETEAILSIDDDAHLRHDEIVFGFRVWREARDRIVGFPGRYHEWDLRNNNWLYNSNYSCELSMILTGAAFYHKYYSYQYSYVMPQAIRDMVDNFVNCEDIAMNFLVSHITRKPPVKVTSRWTFRCPGCPQALSIDNSHFQERHKCMQFFTKVYGYMPLLYTQFRADSVLFKTRLPHDKQKCFRFI